MKHSFAVLLLLGLAACGAPHKGQNPRPETLAQTDGITISGEARVGVKTSF